MVQAEAAFVKVAAQELALPAHMAAVAVAVLMPRRAEAGFPDMAATAALLLSRAQLQAALPPEGAVAVRQGVLAQLLLVLVRAVKSVCGLGKGT